MRKSKKKIEKVFVLQENPVDHVYRMLYTIPGETYFEAPYNEKELVALRQIVCFNNMVSSYHEQFIWILEEKGRVVLKRGLTVLASEPVSYAGMLKIVAKAFEVLAEKEAA